MLIVGSVKINDALEDNERMFIQNNMPVHLLKVFQFLVVDNDNYIEDESKLLIRSKKRINKAFKFSIEELKQYSDIFFKKFKKYPFALSFTYLLYDETKDLKNEDNEPLLDIERYRTYTSPEVIFDKLFFDVKKGWFQSKNVEEYIKDIIQFKKIMIDSGDNDHFIEVDKDDYFKNYLSTSEGDFIR